MSITEKAPLMLSVSGARGIVGRSMTPSVAAEFAAVFGTLVQEARGPHAVVYLGRDSRPSGQALAAAALAGLVSVGCRVVEIGVVTTPTVGVMIDAHDADAGVVITASHNPIMWNGLKCLDDGGSALPAATAETLIRRFGERAITFAKVEDLQPVAYDESAHDTHLDRVMTAVDVESIRAAGFRVTLDSVNGAGAAPGRALLERLGCVVDHLNGVPDGRFAHEPEPVRENLTELAEATSRGGSACGFAQDPDADRLAIVDEQGRYIGEEYTLALAARRVLALNGGGAVAANLSTSRMVDDVVARCGGRVVRTAVGEANVVSAMRETGALVGGEGNGGVIYPPVSWVRDSLSAMALVLGLMADEGRPLSAIVDELPHYGMIKQKLELDAIGGRAGVDAAIERIVTHFGDEHCNTSDGVRVEFTDGWGHFRPSNTEPIARLIAEAPTEAQANQIAADVSRAAGLV